MSTFAVEGDQFLLDGKPLRLLSGAVHYFRSLPEQWEHRLRALQALGLNTVETYVPWNFHEPRPGQFCFTGRADLEAFVRLAQTLGLHVLVRPGPFICSEWEFGGLPSWLLADPTMRLRCAHPAYLAAVDRYFDELIPRLAALQVTRGGPVLMVQVENEYGSYGNDTPYLRHLADGLRRRGVEVPLFTSDGGADWLLQGGTLEGAVATVNFGSGAAREFAGLRRHRPGGPLMVSEFWVHNGDNLLHWGESRRPRDPQEVAALLTEILEAGASVNFYMFHGGTNFGFLNGGNYYDGYLPTINSYDMDAPLSEAGDATPKFWACREVLARYHDNPLPEPPPPAPRVAYGEVELPEEVSLWEALGVLSTPVERVTPEPMEYLGQDYGFLLYRTRVTGPREEGPLVLQELHDRAQVFVDGEYRGVLQRDHPELEVRVAFGPGEHQLDLLVENLGRINFGPHLVDRKGITEGVALNGQQFLYHWTHFPLPLDDLAALPFRPGEAREGPLFRRGFFPVETPADTFLALPGWTKGQVFLNGVNLSRYWRIGPQLTCYVPAPLLRPGQNELIVFELHGLERPVVEFVDAPRWGPDADGP